MNTNSLASTRTVSQTIDVVKNSPSSIFTKDDVLNLLTSISNGNGSITKAMVDDLMEQIESGINNVDSEDVVDKSTAEFSLDGNQIELDSIEVDSSYIVDEVGHVVNHWYETNFE